ncbi:MAG TPA: DNA polymerase III subunit delta [Acidimicrobiales bacterium]|nr:DNA polymerase III subunit delta [Acidimicrobiales bacterium]
MTARRGTEGASAPRAYFVRGEDASLIGQEARDVIRRLAGDNDVAMVVEEMGGPGSEELDIGMVVDALTTPPFLADRRIVVVRDAGRLNPSEAERIAACLADPLPDVFLVLVAGGGTVPATLVKAVDRVGGTVDAAVGSGRARTDWLREQFQSAPVRLDARAAARLGEHLGEDVSRLHGVLDMLAGAFGEGAAIDVERLEPFLGEAGTVAPWTLTDAIDAGYTAEALAALERMSGAVRWHPLAILGLLHRHYQAMLRLDGSGVTTPDEAARYLGMRSVYPAKKAIEQSRKLGPARIGRAITLLAEADLDIRGLSGLPDETVLQVLVGRLTRLASPRQAASRRQGRSGRQPA